ncbi:hypothetical protein [Streptomyces prunicolor]|uniref:hypothetical protein n=1 Tax=Streptomyces prunicolor TaxID=67348 RepID=UPI003869EDEF
MSKTAVTSATVPDAAPNRPGLSPSAAPAPLHRAITLLAVIALFIGTRADWTTAIAKRPTIGVSSPSVTRESCFSGFSLSPCTAAVP